MASFSSARTLLFKPSNFIESLTHKFPRFYLSCVALVAIFGYAFVLLFPLLVLAGLLNIYTELVVSDVTDWQATLTWLVIILVAALVSYRGTQIKLKPPVGLTLTEAKAPGLFKLVQQHRSYYKRPTIHRIVITEHYELDIVKTPMWTLPVWSTNTMIIGLPVMQCLSPEQFECMVARRIGQFSKRYNPVTNWLYQLRSIWQQYRVSYNQQKGFGIEPLKWFYSIYAPMYSRLSVYAARQDELNADTYAMELFNDKDVLEMITADALYRWYLHNQYWPAVVKIASIETKSLPTPHTKMSSAVRAIKNGEQLDKLIDNAYREQPLTSNATPSLQDRISSIGHQKPCMEKDTSENAAMFYLGASVKGVVDIVDKLWLKSFLEQRKKHHRQNKIKPAQKQVTSN
jgi:hypothetical protein